VARGTIVPKRLGRPGSRVIPYLGWELLDSDASR
jgi:hypothetical protein